MSEYNKFQKNRSVDRNWLNIPTAYLSENGQHTSPDYKNIPMSFNEYLNYFLMKHSNNEIMAMLPEDIRSEYERLKEDDNDCFAGYRYLEEYIKNNFYPKYLKTVKKEWDKEFTIIQFYGKHWALCGWRNTNKCNQGMTFMCPVITKKGISYLKYKGKNIKLSNAKAVF